MLAEAIIRVGRPIMQSDIPEEEKIRMLTDVSSENCKNFFQNIFLVEVEREKTAETIVNISFQWMRIGNFDADGKKFQVDQQRSVSFPVIYPHGGNPRKAQGIYALPCYLLYDYHIKEEMGETSVFAQNFLIPRLQKTIGYQSMKKDKLEGMAEAVAKVVVTEALTYITSEKQLGILMIFDRMLPEYERLEEKNKGVRHLRIAESKLFGGKQLYLNSREVLAKIVKAKTAEAATLGEGTEEISTFSNRKSAKVVSIYNKSWLWLSPTWEMPRSIYWEEKNWTKGIKVDLASYEAYLYGSQFLKELQVPVSSSILKEMFAPITSAEAKKHIKPTSFEAIFGIPLVLPITDDDSRQYFEKYRKMLKNPDELSQSDLHLDVLAGIKKVLPKADDNHRLTILYYSGDISRGDMHIRAVIEDVLPSVAIKIQEILRELKRQGREKIQSIFGLEVKQIYKTENLPSVLGNAFGSGYLWSALQSALHKKPLRTTRLRQAVAKKLNELANKEDYWAMKQELAFYYCFLYFLKRYEERILFKEGEVKELTDWQNMIKEYHQGELRFGEINSVEKTGFISGLLLKQFSGSYYQKTGKDFVKHRVMKFGSKLTPEMVWKKGLLRCEELAAQWDLGLAKNFREALPLALLAFLDLNHKKLLVSQSDIFMTAFWSGHLIYQQTKKSTESGQGEENNVSEIE